MAALYAFFDADERLKAVTLVGTDEDAETLHRHGVQVKRATDGFTIDTAPPMYYWSMPLEREAVRTVLRLLNMAPRHGSNIAIDEWLAATDE